MATKEYFKTSAVDVFPSSLRNKVTSGKQTSEKNLANIINSITNTEHRSYVVSFTEQSLGSTTGSLDVVLGGYFFTVRDFNLAEGKWLNVCIETKNGRLVSWSKPHNIELDQDVTDGNFLGLFQSDEEQKPAAEDGYTFISFNVSDGTKIINYYRLNSDSLSYKETNGTIISVKEKIDQKQQKLDVAVWKDKGRDNPILIEPEGDVDRHTLNFDDSAYTKYTDLGSKGGPTSDPHGFKPIYTENGEVKECIENIGSHDIDETAGSPMKETVVFVKEGSIIEGQTFYISSKSPSDFDADIGNIGDFWFKYEKED